MPKEEHQFLQKQIDEIKESISNFFSETKKIIRETFDRIEEKFDIHNREFGDFKLKIYKHIDDIEKLPELKTKVDSHHSYIMSQKEGKSTAKTIIIGVLVTVLSTAIIALAGFLYYVSTIIDQVTIEEISFILNQLV